MSRFKTIAVAAWFALAAPAAGGQEQAPYDARLYRLAEVLGSVHFLRNLCGEKSDAWRVDMQKLLEAENPEPERRARMIASFNHGYRAFSATYTTCTESATESISRYMIEGEKLAREVVARYGN
jgi:uncharacterized protein (TIGR02301 family)